VGKRKNHERIALEIIIIRRSVETVKSDEYLFGLFKQMPKKDRDKRRNNSHALVYRIIFDGAKRLYLFLFWLHGHVLFVLFCFPEI
jgi:hypothetical protein